MFRLRAGIIGMGSIGPVHLEAARRLGAEVVALVGSTEEKAHGQADSLGVPSAYGDYRALLERPDVEVVHICTPNHLHFPMARDALAAGKHVICEKPLGLDSRESSLLLDMARQSGLVHAVNFNNRFYPLVQHARDLIRQGELGRLFAIRGACLMDSLLYETDYNWRLDLQSGGLTCVLSTVGSHLIDLLTYVSGQAVVEVCADFSTVHPVRRPAPASLGPGTAQVASGEPVEKIIRTEDSAGALLRYDSGARGSLTVSQVSAGRKYCHQLEVDGAKAALTWQSEEPNTLWLGYRDQANHVLPKDPSLLSVRAAQYVDHPGGCAEGFGDTFKQFLGCVYAAIRKREGGEAVLPDFPTFADGHAERLVNDALAGSATTGGWVRVSRPSPQME